MEAVAIVLSEGGHLEETTKVLSTALEDEEVLIKVEFCALAPFDLYQVDLEYFVEDYPWTCGMNVSGVVQQVGAGIEDLRAGDRVIAFAYSSEHKGLQEYTVQQRSVVAKIPDDLPFEDAATVVDNFVTAFYVLFNQLGLPLGESFPPEEPPEYPERPILIYGAGSTSGQYAIQLLKLAGYTNTVATASLKHHAYLLRLGATRVIDYHSSFLSNDITQAVGGDGMVDLVMDCVSLDDSLFIISKVVRPGATVAFLVPVKHKGDLTGRSAQMLSEIPESIAARFPENVKMLPVRTLSFEQDERLRNWLIPSVLPRLLEAKLIQPNRVILVDEGTLLERVEEAFSLLREGKVSGEKAVVKVGQGEPSVYSVESPTEVSEDDDGLPFRDGDSP